jgi:hypothetical protein
MSMDKMISISDSDLEWNGIGEDDEIVMAKGSSIGG